MSVTATAIARDGWGTSLTATPRLERARHHGHRSQHRVERRHVRHDLAQLRRPSTTYDYAGQDPINESDPSGENINSGRLIANGVMLISPHRHPVRPEPKPEPKPKPGIEEPREEPPSGEGKPPGLALPTFPPGGKEPGAEEPGEGATEPEGEPTPEKSDFRVASVPWLHPIFGPLVHGPQVTFRGLAVPYGHRHWP